MWVRRFLGRGWETGVVLWKAGLRKASTEAFWCGWGTYERWNVEEGVVDLESWKVGKLLRPVS